MAKIKKPKPELEEEKKISPNETGSIPKKEKKSVNGNKRHSPSLSRCVIKTAKTKDIILDFYKKK